MNGSIAKKLRAIAKDLDVSYTALKRAHRSAGSKHRPELMQFLKAKVENRNMGMADG